MVDILRPTYDMIHEASVDIGNKASNLNYDYVLGVTRGGLLPATIISNILRTPMIPVSYSSKHGKGDNKNHLNDIPDIKDSVILIVDDICDSGYTFLELSHFYKQFNNIIVTGAIYYKERAAPLFTPNIVWTTIPEDSDWVIFPWD